MLKTNTIKVVAFLGLLLAFVACGPSKEEQEKEARFNYAKKTVSDLLSVDTVGTEKEAVFIVTKNAYMQKVAKIVDMQQLVDSIYALENWKLKRCQKLSGLVPSSMPNDMKEQIDVLWSTTCSKYQLRLGCLDAFAAYMKAKTKENKNEVELECKKVEIQSNLMIAQFNRLADMYGKK
ncbi:hypothetical protein [Fibrobacter sp.]|uniref:hypothetical protein n=1 Tax=Fibrobacter sp. TaxID=35828 RepID=UPI0025BA3871|nr:hypothetical protein [Fibrobacter sp.]MBR3072240.1 hypothetical protein [Fibrobacter sp.]